MIGNGTNGASSLGSKRGLVAALGLLLLITLSFFWIAATIQGAFFFGDIFQLHYPEQMAFRRALAEGRLPLWSTEVFGGYPLLAEGQFGPFYPPNWLLLLAPIDVAINLSILVHLLWAGLGMYSLGRLLGLAWWPSLVGGIVYAFGGFSIAHLNHLNILAVVSWLPAAFAAARSSVAELCGGRRIPLRVLVALASCLALMLLAGHPQVALLGLLLILADAVWQVASTSKEGVGAGLMSTAGPKARHAIAASGALGGALFLAIGIAAAQLLPTMELTSFSLRAGGLDADFFASFSLHPALLALLASPFLLGDPYPKLAVELVGYVGMLPLLLAGWAIARDRQRARFFALVALVALLLALGRWNPLYLALLRVPVLNWFRVPARFLLLFTFAVAILAAMGADALQAELGRASGRQGSATLAILGMASLILVAWLGSAVSVEALLGAWRFLPAILLVGSLVVLWAAWHKSLRADLFQGVCLLLLVVDLGAFGAVYAKSYNATMPRAQFREEPRSLDFIRRDSDLARVMTHEEITPVLPVMRESLFPNIAMIHGVQGANGYFPLTPARWAALWSGMTPALLDAFNVKYYLIPQVLPVDEASEFYDLENPFSPSLVGRAHAMPPTPAGALIIESYVSHSVDLVDGALAAEILIEAADGQRVPLPLRIGLDTAEWAYDRSDVQTSIRHSKPAIARSWPARSGFPPEDHPGYVYQTEYALGDALQVVGIEIRPHVAAAYLRVERCIFVAPDGQRRLLSDLLGYGDHTLAYRSEDVAIYENHQVLPRAYLVHRALVEPDQVRALELVMAAEFDPASLAVLDAGRELVGDADPRDRVILSHYGADRIVVEAASDAEGYLVLGDAHYPGWAATVDGAPAEVHLANGYVRAVHLKPGEHRVVFEYRPVWFRVGAGLSLLCLGVWCALAVLSMRHAADGARPSRAAR